MQVFPTAPSPTVTHLMNLAVLILSFLLSLLPLKEKKSDEGGNSAAKRLNFE